MRNFDEERAEVTPVAERQFTLGGHVFTRRDRVRPEALAQIEDAGMAGSSSDVLVELDKGVLMFLEDDEKEAYTKVRTDEKNPVSLRDLQALSEWLVEEETKLPTTAPSASTDGRSTTPSSSPEQSSLPEADPS